MTEQVLEDIKMLLEYVQLQQLADNGCVGAEILDEMLVSPEAFAETLSRLRRLLPK